MAIDSSKATLGDLFRRCNAELNTSLTPAQMAAGQAGSHWTTYAFIDKVNVLARELSGETEYLERYYIARADVGVMRYIKFTRQQGDGGLLRINLDGQTATLPSGEDDVDCIGGQYEKVCDGTGIDFDYEGNAGTGVLPDSIPKIYLPAEADIDPANYDPTSAIARIRSASGMENYPQTNNIFDIEFIGWSSAPITDTDNYPTAEEEDKYFVNGILIAAMQTLQWSTGNDGAFPRSADAYLNDTWADILGITVDGDCTGAGAGTNPFTFDGIVYTVSVPGAPDNYTIDGVQTVTVVVTGANPQQFVINMTETPWQTMLNNSSLFTPYFQTANQDKAWYLKFDAQRIKLPDDVEKIEWIIKIPKYSFYDDVNVDADEDNELKPLGDSLTYLYNPIDYENHYYPVTETLFTYAKNRRVNIWVRDRYNNYTNTYAGLYLQKGQQIYLEPKHTDPILISARCRPDLADATIDIDEFDDVYLEIPAIAVDCIMYRMLSDYHIGKRGDAAASDRWMMRYKEAVARLKNIYKAKMGQSDDGSPLGNRLYPKRSNSFGYNLIPDPTRRFGQ